MAFGIRIIGSRIGLSDDILSLIDEAMAKTRTTPASR
jgi:hypothetical protein